MRRLERELVLAYETGAEVTVVLTKADLVDDEARLSEVRDRVRALVGADVGVLVMSVDDPASVEAVRALMPAGVTAVLIGRSGVGKSSLVNLLLGSDVHKTAAVREGDGKGRHTTVSREIIDLPGGGRVVDMRAYAVWGYGTPMRASRRRSRTSSGLPRHVVFATASTRKSPAAPFAPPWRPAISHPRGSPRTKRCARRPKPSRSAASRRVGCSVRSRRRASARRSVPRRRLRRSLRENALDDLRDEAPRSEAPARLNLLYFVGVSASLGPAGIDYQLPITLG